MAVADLNGDGRPDLAVANYDSNTVSVLLNTTAPGAGVPSFTPQRTFATDSRPSSVLVGDFNSDGRPDLAVTNFGSTTVSVLLNMTAPGGTVPSFAAHQPFAVGPLPSWNALADFNGDGKLDLAVDHGADRVAVLLNNSELPITILGSPATGTIADDDAPVFLAIAAGNTQRGLIGTAFAIALAVDVRNAAGNLVQGATVLFLAPETGPSGTFPGGTTVVLVVTNASGRATAPAFTANLSAGRYDVLAVAAEGANPSVNFSLRNVKHIPRLDGPLVAVAAFPVLGPVPLIPPGPRPRGVADPTGGTGVGAILAGPRERVFAAESVYEWDPGALVAALRDEEWGWF